MAAVEDSESEKDGWSEHPPVAELRRGPKDPRSKAKYNIFSRLLFCWLEPLFCTGVRQSLEQEDLYVHPEETESRVLLAKFKRYWEQELEKKRRGGKARLWPVLIKCICWRLVVQTVLVGIELTLLVGQSVILGYLVGYFSIDNPTSEETRNAYLFAAGLVLATPAITLFHAHAFLLGQKSGMLTRISTTGAIYDKVLRLSQSTVGQVTIGHVVNLASNDVQRFDLAFFFFPYLLLGPLHLVAFTYLVYAEIGWPAFLASAFAILQIVAQLFLARLFAKLRLKSAHVTDQRVKVMNEVISGIRVIKMYAWEYAFKRVVAMLRKKESNYVLKADTVQGCTSAFDNLFKVVISALIFATFAAIGGILSPRVVFTTLALILGLRQTVFYMAELSYGLLEAGVSIVRIQHFLELDELPKHTREVESNQNGKIGNRQINERSASEIADSEAESLCPHPSEEVDKNYVSVDRLSASWSFDEDKMVLSNLSFEVTKECPLLAVVGPVGAGKSTILQCLLGELEPMEGSIELPGRVSYASQESWIFSSTLRDNVLFGLPYQKDWYDSVIEACALDKDITQLVDGDMTLVGERGVTLSGGQKARVNLARAVYRDADVYLLDDPLSAVDTAVGKHLFEKCIRGVLNDKLVILITHQLQFAEKADRILAIKEGSKEAYGTNAQLVADGFDPTQLMGIEKDERDEFLYEDEAYVEEEEGVYTRHISSSRKTAQTEHTYSLTADTASIFTSHSMLSLHSVMDGGSSRMESEKGGDNALTQPPEDKAHGSVTMMTYVRYFMAGGGYFLLLFVMVVFVLGEGSVVIPDWWLSDCFLHSENVNRWADCSILNISSNSTRSTCLLSSNQRIGIYIGTIVVAIAINFMRTILFCFVCVNASRVLHNRMFASVLRAPILFFDTNPIGRVLNRFSKDIGFLDNLLPYQFFNYLQLLLRVVAILLTASAFNVYVLIPAAILVVVFLALRWYYLKTSRDVKRLEAIARSPFYSHISTTLQGLSTIRTFGKETMALDLYHRYQNEHSQGWYLYLTTLRWFGMRMDFFVGVFIAAVAFTFLPLSSTVNAGLAGLSLVYSLSLTDLFQFCVRQSAEVENVMISAERVMGYSNLESEASLETLPPNQKPCSEWPNKGCIEMDDVCFRYSEDLPLVLKSLSLYISSGEKIGVIGRTGAGKSSILAVLFRLAESFGMVTIDNVETKDIGLHDLRKKISIIPQDPVLFSGTMRYNLDPFDEYTDVKLWEVLEQVQLKSAVEGLEGGLQGQVSEGGSNFSVGQKQLVCLARALLRKNKILVLDEATANVDIYTDGIIQQAIRENLSECTVLTIAHRLNTIMDSDRILVMNRGQVREFDSPLALLHSRQSLFSKMVEQTGPTASRKLRQMAEEAHLRRRRSITDGTEVLVSGSHLPVILVSQETTV